MRELDQLHEGHAIGAIERVAIVGPGRLGTAIAAALTQAGVAVDGPYGRRDPIAERLGPRRPRPGRRQRRQRRCRTRSCCVSRTPRSRPSPASIATGAPVGHCSGATTLDVLAPHERFSLHPLMTVPADAPADVLAEAGAAVAGSTPRALALALALAQRLAMRPIEIVEADRAAYHAAACIASNFLVTLEAAAERVAATAGLSVDLLVPLVRATVENWATLGPQAALTGPVARGDEPTIERQRSALVERAPELLELFDACVDATRQLAARPAPKAVAA